MRDLPGLPDIKVLLACLALILGAGAACGVKGPPLPPIPSTPQQSELHAAPAPSPVAKGKSS